jgi:hypothetical protein
MSRGAVLDFEFSAEVMQSTALAEWKEMRDASGS